MEFVLTLAFTALSTASSSDEATTPSRDARPEMPVLDLDLTDPESFARLVRSRTFTNGTARRARGLALPAKGLDTNAAVDVAETDSIPFPQQNESEEGKEATKTDRQMPAH